MIMSMSVPISVTISSRIHVPHDHGDRVHDRGLHDSRYHTHRIHGPGRGGVLHVVHNWLDKPFLRLVLRPKVILLKWIT